jgi:hypothetical protein
VGVIGAVLRTCLNNLNVSELYCIYIYISCCRYRVVSEQELEKLRGDGKIVYEGEEKGLFGFSAPVRTYKHAL